MAFDRKHQRPKSGRIQRRDFRRRLRLSFFQTPDAGRSEDGQDLFSDLRSPSSEPGL